MYFQAPTGNGKLMNEKEIENGKDTVDATDGDEVEVKTAMGMTVFCYKYIIKLNAYQQAKEKEEILSKSPYFRVEVSILCGRELIAMDRGGTSDPYVRIMQGEEQLHKTVEKKQTVNPVWNDQANVYIDNPFTPLTFQVGFSMFYQVYLLCLRFLIKTWQGVMISWVMQILI